MLFGKTLRTVAIFEAAKAALALIAGFGLMSLGPRTIEHFVERLVAHSQLNPAAHYPRIFLEIAHRATNVHLLLIAAGALAYSAVRLVEAYGLWHGRRWAEWFAAASGAVYIPFEVMELQRRITWIGVGALILNVAIVGVMLYCVFHSGPKAPREGGSGVRT
jgi:uncharacterized membrane protein (DUF2068 family)